jgi:hypothetical protein
MIIAAISVSEVFTLAESQPYGASHSHNQYQPVYASLVQLLLGGWHWLRDRVDHDTISTLAIVTTAIFTGTLWWSTKLLWESSDNHAHHAEKAIRVAEISAQRQLRAYVHVEEISMRHVNSEWSPNIRVKFRNFGLTPALKVIHKCSSSLVMVDEPKIPDREKTELVVDLGPSQDQTTTMIIPLCMWDGFLKPIIISGAGKFFVFGEIAYFDISQDQSTERPHFTRYKMYISTDDEGIPEGGGLVFANEGNETS